MARKLDLHRRDVDAGYAMATRQLARAGHSPPAPELEDVGPVGKARVEVTQPIDSR